MKKIVIFILVFSTVLISCSRNQIHSNKESWKEIKVKSSNSSNKEEDKFKTAARVIGADVTGALAGGGFAAKYTIGNPWAIGICAVLVGGLSSYGASGVDNGQQASWPSSNSENEFVIEYNTLSNNNNWFNDKAIDHNSLMVNFAQEVNLLGRRLSINEAFEIAKNDPALDKYKLETNYILEIQDVQMYLNIDGEIDLNLIRNESEFNHINFQIIDSYLENLNASSNVEDFINYSISFEESIASNIYLTKEEKNATLVFCAIGRASAIYWNNHDFD